MISNIEYCDVIKISKMLKSSKSISTNKVAKEIMDHLGNDKSLALKLKANDKIVGVWCSKEFETHTSLSFFYTDESIRKKPDVIVFFMHCYRMINNNKPILICTKDTTGFDKYVERVEGSEDIYVFKGLR